MSLAARQRRPPKLGLALALAPVLLCVAGLLALCVLLVPREQAGGASAGHCGGLPYFSQIEQDLSPWRASGIYRSSLEEAAAEDALLVVGGESYTMKLHLQLHEGRLYSRTGLNKQALHGRGPMVLSFFQKMLCAAPEAARRISAEFVVNLWDEPQLPASASALRGPVLSPQKDVRYNDILYPYPEYYGSWGDLVGRIRNASVPAAAKQERLVWRGSQTGCPRCNYTRATWRTFPRSRLVLFCQQRPDLCDAGFTSWTQVDEEGKRSIQKEAGPLRAYIGLEQQQRFMYIASLDGNGWATRFAPLLSSNSAVFKQVSPWREFFYSAVHAYEHYVPLSASLSDVRDSIEWARENPESVQRIIANANAFIDTHLTQDAIFCYTLQLLSAYQQLQQFKVGERLGEPVDELLEPLC